MHHRLLVTLLMSGTAVSLLGLVSALVAAPASATKDTPIPPFEDVELAVKQYFKAKPDFKFGDLITREDVAPLLARLQQMWLPAADAAKIRERLPVQGEFLVNQLSTPDGRKFMRRIASYPDAYDRLDRLSRMPHGQQTVSALVRGPGGEKMIEYMTETPGGRELGKQLSNAPTGRNFNAPTGRIYTVAMLLEYLQQCHTAAVNAAEGNAVDGNVPVLPPKAALPTPADTQRKSYP